MPYIGEIRMFAGSFSPAGWEFCSGQLIPIAENDALYMLLGTTFGGDGQSTFGLPDLRGRLPLHQGSGFVTGNNGGSEEVTLTTAQMPNHNHAALASASNGSQASPVGAVLAQPATSGQIADPKSYGTDPPIAQFPAATIGPRGGSQPHTNMQPYLVVSFIISLFGEYPRSN